MFEYKILNMTSENSKNDAGTSDLSINEVKDKIPLILNGDYFKIHKINGNNVDAICCICKLHYKGFLNATSNFSKHLKV